MSNEHYQQPPLPLNTPCCRCGRVLDQTRGAGWWSGRWWCLPCLAKGKSRMKDKLVSTGVAAVAILLVFGFLMALAGVARNPAEMVADGVIFVLAFAAAVLAGAICRKRSARPQ